MKIRTETPKTGAIKWVAFSCSHCPLQDLEAVELVKEAVRDFKPDQIVMLGDLHEANSASKWPSEYSWNIEDEYIAASKMLREIRMAHPHPDQVKGIFLPGNHDANIEAINRHPKAVRQLLSWRYPQNVPVRKGGRPVYINEEFVTNWRIACEYRYSRKRGVYRIGATVFAHGYAADVSSDENQAIDLGWTYGLTVTGHTHRPTRGEPRQVMKTKKRPLPWWYLNAGCTSDLYPQFMERHLSAQWGNAVSYGWSVPINSPRFDRNTWDAYCEVGKMHESAF
jgi:predicted phosphodiesterase